MAETTVTTAEPGMSMTTIVIIFVVVFFVIILIIVLLAVFLRNGNRTTNGNGTVGPQGPAGPTGPQGPAGPPGPPGDGSSIDGNLLYTREIPITIPSNATGTVTVPFYVPNFFPENYTVSLLVPNGYGRRSIIPSNSTGSSAAVRFDTYEANGSLIVNFYGGSHGGSQATLSVTAFNARRRRVNDFDWRQDHQYYN